MREVIGTVLENVRIAADIFSLTFATDEAISVRSGQFCMVGVDGFPLRRPLAVCKAEGVRITVCYQVRGKGTKTLSLRKQGERLSVLLPLGNGFTVPKEAERIAVIGGGAGIFPIVSSIREFSSEHEVYAYAGFKNRAAVCMEYDMRRAKKLSLATDDGSYGSKGTAVQAFMEEVEEVRPSLVLACGPVPMLRALKNATLGRGIPVQVSLEERMGCGIGACLVCVCGKKDGTRARVCKDGPVFNIEDVVL